MILVKVYQDRVVPTKMKICFGFSAKKSLALVTLLMTSAKSPNDRFNQSAEFQIIIHVLLYKSESPVKVATG